MTSSEIFMETQRIGRIIRVSAIDAKTGIEVVFQAPSSTPPSGLKKLAISKLSYVIRKEREAKGPNIGE
jgi:hypothetical protein